MAQGVSRRPVVTESRIQSQARLCVHNNNNNNNITNKDPTIEIQRMWNVKTKVIPVIIGATGTISESFRKYVSNIPGNHEVNPLAYTDVPETAGLARSINP